MLTFWLFPRTVSLAAFPAGAVFFAADFLAEVFLAKVSLEEVFFFADPLAAAVLCASLAFLAVLEVGCFLASLLIAFFLGDAFFDFEGFFLVFFLVAIGAVYHRSPVLAL